MNKTLIVTLQTYLQQVKTWSFLILLLSPFFFIGISGLSGFSAGKGLSDNSSVAVIAPTAVRQQVLKNVNLDYAESIKTTRKAQKALNDGTIDAYVQLTVGQKQIKVNLHGTDAGISAAKSPIMKYVARQQSRLNLASAQLSNQQSQALKRQPQIVELAQNTGPNKLAQKLTYFIMIILVYFILTTYSSITAQEIASEKGTKIMEIIFSSTTARKYFNGKILGVLLVIMTQILVYVVGGGLGLLAIRQNAGLNHLLSSNGQLIQQIAQGFNLMNIAFMILGVIIYTVLAALTGALVSRAEDASKAAQPVVMLSVLSFVAAMSQMGSPTGLVTRVLSYVPFFSSFFMPLRIINGSANGLQSGTALLILILTVLGLIWYIGRIYQRLMLQTDNVSIWTGLRRAIRTK